MHNKYGPIYKENIGGCPVVSIHQPADIALVMHIQGRTPVRGVNEANIRYRKSNPKRYNTVGLVDT